MRPRDWLIPAMMLACVVLGMVIYHYVGEAHALSIAGALCLLTMAAITMSMRGES